MSLDTLETTLKIQVDVQVGARLALSRKGGGFEVVHYILFKNKKIK